MVLPLPFVAWYPLSWTLFEIARIVSCASVLAALSDTGSLAAYAVNSSRNAINSSRRAVISLCVGNPIDGQRLPKAQCRFHRLPRNPADNRIGINLVG